MPSTQKLQSDLDQAKRAMRESLEKLKLEKTRLQKMKSDVEQQLREVDSQISSMNG